MSSLIFYCAPGSSASPVASVLYELDVPHEKVTFDLKQNKHKLPDFLELNPNGKVPTLVIDGTPMFEALAIMLWLGDRYGVTKGLWPAFDSPERAEAFAWSTWAYVSYGTLLVRLTWSASPTIEEKFHNQAHAQQAREELDQLLSILEERLSKRGFVVGDSYSLADLIVASVVGYGTWAGKSVDSFPRVSAWLKDFQARPAYAAGF